MRSGVVDDPDVRAAPRGYERSAGMSLNALAIFLTIS